MIAREIKKLLLDILNSIKNVDLHLEYRGNFAEYPDNITRRRAVEREIGIIGEAMSKILKINPEIEISYSRIIVDLRNKIIHAYDNVDDIII